MPRKNAQPIALCDTRGMTREAWLEMRTGKYHNIPCTIGGSEVAAIVDESPFVTSKEVFDKKQKVKPVIVKDFNEDAKMRGIIYEPYVQEMFIWWFERNYKIKLKVCSSIEEFNNERNAVYNDKHFYQCGIKDENGKLKYPFAVADVDAIVKINGRIGILEYKTTSSKGKIGRKTMNEWRSGIVPRHYAYQPPHYMAVLNVDYAFICCAWGLEMTDFAVIPIQRDFDFEDEMLEKERAFVDAVINDMEWDTSYCDPTLLANYYTRLYGTAPDNGKSAVLPKSYFNLLKRLVERKEKRDNLMAQIEAMDKEDDELIAIIQPEVQDADYVTCRNGSQIISIKINTPKEKVECIDIDKVPTKAHIDINRLSAEHPEMIDRYNKTIFDVRTFKTENPGLYTKYRTPALPTGETKTYKATIDEIA